MSNLKVGQRVQMLKKTSSFRKGEIVRIEEPDQDGEIYVTDLTADEDCDYLSSKLVTDKITECIGQLWNPMTNRWFKFDYLKNKVLETKKSSGEFNNITEYYDD